MASHHLMGLVARADDSIPDFTDPWPTKDIVYVSIIAPLMLMALLEWFLWVAAFMYCIVKVFQKAETMSVRILYISHPQKTASDSNSAIFLPIMVVTLPLPPQVTKYFPQEMVGFLQWFAFWSFAGLLTVPWLFCVYQLVTHSVGRSRRIKSVLDESSAPKVVIVMPCYKEIPEILLRTCDSLVDCEYPPSCLHIFLSFDGDQEDELYLNTIEKLGVPLTLDSYPKSIDVIYRSCRITISRFPHGGKRHCQKRTFKLIDKIYTEYLKRNDNLFVLFIDSDCILDKTCIQNFMYEMELKPGSKKNMLAQTGVITSTTEKQSLITLLQDMEYVHGQLFERSVESGCGAVTCLPGALTMLRFSAFRKMAKYYFADKAEQCDDLFDYGKCHLGEDRWLTHLFMVGAKERYQIQMNPGAFCKTEAVQTYQSLLKQRRRWFLGFITNEVCMLTDIRLWKRYPILLVVRFMQNTIRTTALLFFILCISLMTTSQAVKNLPVGFIAISLGLNWLLMLYFGAKLGRYKIMLYPLMFVINPFFNWMYMVYGIFTAGQRTWGGPRADAGTADAKTTPQEAIENAEANGDDLNVVPETFKAAAEAKKSHAGGAPLQPSDNIDGRFAAAERLPNGWYQQGNDSGLTLPNTMPRNPNVPHVPLHPRTSMDSFASYDTSANNSVYLPRRVESFMDPEDARVYHKTQQTQKPAGGAFFEEPRTGPYQVGAGASKGMYSESVDSVDDDSVYNSKNTQQLGQSRTSPLSAGQKPPLESPKPSYNRSNSMDQRQGRSPLAYQSYVQTTPGDDIELQAPQQSSLMRDVSPAPLGQPVIPAASHGRSDSTDSKKRNRLSKQKPSK
ncbi:glycosyltransferase family 2 protein [Bipolaris zeicola 26-R-13]|uniref:chitin synthase n=1 Tax=Cochliobolus carbonum (strain 26-R-13) TaxID=930089 RepID=W6YAS8_COCC2|nr:glycosyltransferase family 2 protein [Bipolaris zeicola 26-R-13]EUC35073.1 glycosyltransferase family 2 protein [Bipolaris zeicola 26-R-13]